MEETRLLFESFGFKPTDYENKLICDLGAGSRMRGKFFLNARQIIIEPMAEKCINEIQWCDFSDAEKVFSVPAEKEIIELKNKCDFLFSVNVLDHCFDFEKIIKNISSYMKPNSLAFLTFDSHFTTSVGHPLILTEKICEKIFKQNNLKIKKFSKGFPDAFKTIYNKNGYDGNSYCLNYWLIK
jgi:2-polyprenyl-3-methyl-5-hydroxy-6-metoxy-1,4-benzoquinol methylase